MGPSSGCGSICGTSLAAITEAKAVLEDWRHEYNHHRPHQSLGGPTPAAYASHWKQHQHP